MKLPAEIGNPVGGGMFFEPEAARGEELTAKGRFLFGRPAGSSVGVGTRKEVFGSSVRVVTVRSLVLFLDFRFLFWREDMFQKGFRLSL